MPGALHGRVAGALAILALAMGSQSLAQPAGQTIRIIYPFAAGGTGDALVRIVADRLQADLGQPVIVENRTGAAGQIGVNAVKSAAPDGTTLLYTPFAAMTIYPMVYRKLDYDPLKDFRPVSQLVTFDFGLAIGPNVPARTPKKLADWLKANPKEANYGSPGAGALPHFFGLLFGEAAGVKMNHIPYRGIPPALTDLVGGQIPMVSATLTDLVAMHRDGKIRTIASSGPARSAILPDVPTFKESGFDIEGVGWYGMFAPAGTPDAVVERVAKSVADTLKRPEVRERLAGFGFAVTGTTPAELAAIQKDDMRRWEPVVKASGFKAD